MAWIKLQRRGEVIQVEELVEFKLPPFLEGATEEHFKKLAMQAAPPGIDTSEGQMYYDHTVPSAIIAAEITQFRFPIVLQMMFPQFATGEYLDWHGQPYNIIRRKPTKATGEIIITSKKEGQPIPIGTLFFTLGDDSENSKQYRAIENAVIADGQAIVLVEAVEPGVIGNTAAHTIIAVQSGLEIDTVTNLEDVTGGVEAESDESLRERILKRIALAPLSGARRDYERWSKEVDGVGNVIVQPLWNGPQTVRVLITDSNNQVANDDLIERVKEYLDPIEFEGQGEGQAPIGAIVTVDTVQVVEVSVKATITFEDGADPIASLERAKNNINDYALGKSVVRLVEVGAALIETEGILDYSDLTLNDQTGNIELLQDERAVVNEVINLAT